MVYTPEITKQLVESYTKGITVPELALQFKVPERSIIAKLSSLGVYKRKQYLNKQGQVPVKKEEMLEELAELLETTVDMIESLEKANKNVLIMLIRALKVEN